MRDRLLTAGMGAVTAFCLAFGGTACLITGMSLEVSLRVLALWCAVWALVGAGLVVWRLTPLLLAGMAVAGAAAWFYGELSAQAEMLLYTVTDFYHMAYGVGPFYFGAQPPAANTPYDLALFLLCAALTVAGVVAACRGKAANWAATLCLLPLGACLVVTDTVPALWALFLLLLGFLLLILPQSVRRGNPVQGGRLAAMLALPLALALGILFLAVPQEGYQRQDLGVQVFSQLRRLARTLAKELRPDLGNVTVPVSPGLEDLEEMDLSLPRLAGNRSGLILTVTAPQSGPVYLRGASYDIYSGTSWRCSGDNQWESLWPAGGEPLGNVTVQSYRAEPLLYFPYYIARAGWTQELSQGKIPNTENLTYYSFPVFQGPEASVQVRNPPGQGSTLLSLPDETRQWAETLLDQIGVERQSDGYTLDTVRKIASYVRNSARYDLNTPAMPKEETDFARWFLTESDTGYCVHYATAATVLLRAAGVPARFVTGFMAPVQAGRETVVRGGNAHAWVEYYNGSGWAVLECTAAIEGLPLPTEAETQSTETSTSRPTDRPSDPSEFSEPSDPFASSEPTDPSEPQNTQVPGGAGQPGGNDPAGKPFPWAPVLSWVLGIGLAIGAVWGQWKLRLLLRARRFAAGDTNRQALCRWRYHVYLCRLLGQKPNRGLRALAQKAKYSNHTLSPEELAKFDLILGENVAVFQKKPLILQVFYRLIFAIW